MTSSESEGQPRSKKRLRTSNSAEDGGKDGKKARGRPRVDTQDATAADVSRLSTAVLPQGAQGCPAYNLCAR
jgi:hypothetical protein